MDTQANRTFLALSRQAHERLAGARAKAVPVRVQAERALAGGREVVFDFAGIEVTQSFVDELVGALILRQGPDVLPRLIFKNCSPDTRAILEFVAADRCDQFIKTKAH